MHDIVQHVTCVFSLHVKIHVFVSVQVFNKILTLASAAAQTKIVNNTWSNLLLSTNAVSVACCLASTATQYFCSQNFAMPTVPIHVLLYSDSDG